MINTRKRLFCVFYENYKRNNFSRFSNLKIFFRDTKRSTVTEYKIQTNNVSYFCLRNFHFKCYYQTETITPVNVEKVSNHLLFTFWVENSTLYG